MHQKIMLRSLARRARLGIDEVERVFDVVIAFLEEGDRVTIPGLGTFRRYTTTDHSRIKFKTSGRLKAEWKEKFHG